MLRLIVIYFNISCQAESTIVLHQHDTWLAAAIKVLHLLALYDKVNLLSIFFKKEKKNSFLLPKTKFVEVCLWHSSASDAAYIAYTVYLLYLQFLIHNILYIISKKLTTWLVLIDPLSSFETEIYQKNNDTKKRNRNENIASQLTVTSMSVIRLLFDFVLIYIIFLDFNTTYFIADVLCSQ